MIFAREVSDNLTSLVKKIDEATIKNKSKHMGSFVVFLSDSETLEKELKELAAKHKIKECALTIDSPPGPKGYNVAKDADITVVLYLERKVEANHAFKKGEMKAADIDKIIADIAKIVK